METVASEFLRAVRGKRSQIAFARRLGYRGNPITDWEHGRRYPTGAEALRACERAGIDVVGALERFHPAAPPRSASDPSELSRWLSDLRGSTPTNTVAERVGRSRFALSRWLTGKAEPRLPDFFRTVDAMTGRLPDLVAQLVPIEAVPGLLPRFETAASARRLAFELPWTEAILRLLETEAYQRTPHSLTWFADRLGLATGAVDEAIERLRAAELIRWDGAHFHVAGALSVDTRTDPQAVQQLLSHWSSVALARYPQRQDPDLFAYNVMSVSAQDLTRVRDLLRATFREIRTIVAASEPTEVAALLNLQLIAWPTGHPEQPSQPEDVSATDS